MGGHNITSSGHSRHPRQGVSKMRYAVVVLIIVVVFVVFSRPSRPEKPETAGTTATLTGANATSAPGPVLPIERPAINAKKIDSAKAFSGTNMSLLTIGINKFLGEQPTLKLIDSIRVYYPNVKISVADSSAPAEDWSQGLTNVDVYFLPFDAGAAAGRNLLLLTAKTKYVLLLDDDFIFTADTRLEPVLAIMEGSDYDILGGRLWTGSRYMTNNFLIWEDAKTHGHPVILKCVDMFYYRHSVNNLGKDAETDDWEVLDTDGVSPLFIARRDTVADILYDNNLKLGEQSEFFWRAKGRLKIGYTPQFTVLHEKRPADSTYRRYRDRYGPYAPSNNTYVRYMRLKWGSYPFLSLEYAPGACPVKNQSLIASQKKVLRDTWPIGRFMVYRSAKGDDHIATMNLTKGGEQAAQLFTLGIYTPIVDGSADATVITFRDITEMQHINIHMVSCDHVTVASQWLKTADIRHYLLPQSECNPETATRVLLSQQQTYLLLNIAPGHVPKLGETLTAGMVEEAARLIRSPNCKRPIAKPNLPLRYLEKAWSDAAWVNYAKTMPKIAFYVVDYARFRSQHYFVPTSSQKETNNWMCWDPRDPKAPPAATKKPTAKR
eukprot:TRINITY_DN4181_c1_g1_i2.p1 TRINITY_DN4181_c1_g1~~TRINITY_DN4181_c1_g1_i2.p1  ORF type:complete len:606 (+),score=199.92 TRINITY_DN4181_c1_g1_i2:228-2045(+)